MIGQFLLRAGTSAVIVFALICLSARQAPPAEISNSSERLPATDEVRITDISRAVQTNRPISIARPFVQGEIHDFAQALINGSPLPTQCDVKNRWPDGSLKFAIVSFIVPSIPPKGSVTITFSNQPSGNNGGFLTKADMLSPAYNFDGQILLTGTANHRISARSIVIAADSCNDPGNDVDGGRYLCTYWLRGPIVTAVILEDRTTARSFDVNTDGLAGNPLHPIFEAWFYPQNNAVQLGYTLEDDWASMSPVKSARDQTYSLIVTSGDKNPVTEYTNGTFTQITRSRWHKAFWLNQPDVQKVVNVDYNWPYLAQTKFLPHWDTTLKIASSLMATKVRAFAGVNRTLEGCSNCYSGGGGIGNFQKGLNSTGAADWHGPLTTWDIIYLISQNPGMYSVMIGNADLGGRIPYFYREADTDAGHGQHFDAPSVGRVQTFGRVVSINARTQVSLVDTTTQSCNTNYAADWINFGGSGEDTGGWDTDTSHWPNLAYASYLSTGRYAYYEEQIMQSAYAVAGSPGTRGCVQANLGSLRQGSAGYWYIDQERGTDWMARENAMGAFIAVDGSPEQAYFRDKLFANLAVWEGCHNIKNDIPGNYLAAWSYGETIRGGHYPLCAGTTLGSWTQGVNGAGGYQTNAPLNQSGVNAPSSANANFQNSYSSVMIGWIDDFGFCPHTNGVCQMLDYVANRYLNMVLNPASNMYNLSDYVYPTLDASGKQITSWAANQALYASQPTGWPTCGSQNPDEWYAAEGMAAMSYFYTLTSLQGAYSGRMAYDKIRSSMKCINGFPGTDFASGSPKWDITPRQ
jgi:hypothetical protein